MMRFISLILTCAFLGFVATAAEDRPNFIIIYCDDLGYNDIGPFGSENHRTPHLDEMAKEGRIFTDFYVTSGVCSPSRGSLMTGSYPSRIGLHENEEGRWALFPGNSRGLNPDEVTIAEVLRDAGYTTAIVGKWHLGDQPEYLPTRHGFESYFGIPYSNDMGHQDRPEPYVYPPLPLLRDEVVIEEEPDQALITKRYTEESIAFIEANKDKPFFLYLPHTMPHWPQYSSEDFAGKSANGPWGDTVEEIDWSTGEILEALRKNDLDEKTIVIFTSDNGGAMNHGASNEPLDGGKGSTLEGGQRVCMVAWGPGFIPADTKCSELATTMDLLPTFAGMAGAELDPGRVIDGRDIVPLLTGEAGAKTPHEAFFYYYRGQLEAVRSGQWKLRVPHKPMRGKNPKSIPLALFDLESDIGESTNVASENPEVVKMLQGHAQRARRELGDSAKEMEGSGVRAPGHVENAKTLTSN
ncbi:MAG: sulfatase [Verrucomicrobiota bacterium]